MTYLEIIIHICIGDWPPSAGIANYTGLSGGWKLRDNGGIGYYMLTDGTTSFNPGASVDIVGSYTWIWDNS